MAKKAKSLETLSFPDLHTISLSRLPHFFSADTLPFSWTQKGGVPTVVSLLFLSIDTVFLGDLILWDVNVNDPNYACLMNDLPLGPILIYPTLCFTFPHGYF